MARRWASDNGSRTSSSTCCATAAGTTRVTTRVNLRVRRRRHQRGACTEALIGRGDISMKKAKDALRDYQGASWNGCSSLRSARAGEARCAAGESVESDEPDPAPGLATAVDKSLLTRSVPNGHRAPAVISRCWRSGEMAYEQDRLGGGNCWLGSLVARQAGTCRGKDGAAPSPSGIRVIIDRHWRGGSHQRPTPTADRRIRLVRKSASYSYTVTERKSGRRGGSIQRRLRQRRDHRRSISSGEAKSGAGESLLLLPHGHEGDPTTLCPDRTLLYSCGRKGSR